MGEIKKDRCQVPLSDGSWAKADQSNPKTAAFKITYGLVLVLNDLQPIYLADLKAGGYAQNSINTAEQELESFIHWMAGERKLNPRKKVAANVASLLAAVDDTASGPTAAVGS